MTGPAGPSKPSARNSLGPNLILTALLAALIFVAFVPSVRAVTDADIFWHLATGRWIVEHHAVPTVDPFSVMGAEQGARWSAYSWLFEVIVYEFYRAFGWVGIVITTMILAWAITILLFAFVRRRESPLAPAILVTALAVLALWPLFTPRPWLWTLGFFLIELGILLEARAGGRLNRLWILLPLFALWANVHIQFVYGLFLIGLFLLEAAARRLVPARRIQPIAPGEPPPRGLSFGVLALVLVGSTMATLVNPYGWDLYRIIREYAMEAPPPLQDLSPPDFQAVSEWIVTGLGIAAMVGTLLHRPRQPFLALLAAIGIVLFLRSRRDAWFSVALSVAVLAETRPWTRVWRAAPMPADPLPAPGGPLVPSGSPRLAPGVILGATVAAVAFLLAAGNGPQLRSSWHTARQADYLPVAAAEFLHQTLASQPPPDSTRLEGPMFNSFDWGGYLIWALPELPVAIDGRTNLHGPERLTRAWITLEGTPGWDDNPDLLRARIVLVETQGPLARRLRADPRYATAYEDSVAAIFVPTGR